YSEIRVEAPRPLTPRSLVNCSDSSIRVTPSGAFNLQYREPFSPDRAALSWLRAAYLVAFAKFGYRFILGKAFHPLRALIASESIATAPLFSIRLPDADRSARALIIVKQPRALARGLPFRWAGTRSRSFVDGATFSGVGLLSRSLARVPSTPPT